MINDITFDIWSSGNFARMEIIRKKNVIQWWILTNSSSSKKILSGVATKFVALYYNQVCSQTLSINEWAEIINK